jgi:hypothetical protein
MLSDILKNVVQRASAAGLSFISRMKTGGVRRHVSLLQDADRAFQNFPEILVTFQTFNKAHTTQRVLWPFLRQGFRNILFFADGCADDTARIASKLLRGRNHFVVNCNNLHEILNYAMAAKLAEWNGTEFLLLAQDDDLYPSDFSWLAAAILLMRSDPDIATIGFNGGYDFTSSIADADGGFSTAAFASRNESGRVIAALKPYYELASVPRPFFAHGYPYNYVDLIDRAPQLVRISFLTEIGGWPRQFSPYNYDDIYICLAAWRSGKKVVHMPLSDIVRNVGIGGMRLFNNVTTTKRPDHLGRNWHILFEAFADFVNSGELRKKVAHARQTESNGETGEAARAVG